MQIPFAARFLTITALQYAANALSKDPINRHVLLGI
jgi:hypothetical protein